MDKPIADRVKSISQSDIRRYSAICAAVNGVNLSQGVCDQPAPDAVKEAAKQAIDGDHAIYTNLRGIIELREAIARKMGKFNGIECDPETEVAVNVGSAGYLRRRAKKAAYAVYDDKERRVELYEISIEERGSVGLLCI